MDDNEMLNYTHSQHITEFLIWRQLNIAIFPQVRGQEAVGIANGSEGGFNKITQSTS